MIEAGARGKAGTPHFAPFDKKLPEMARHFVSIGGFDGLDLENPLEPLITDAGVEWAWKVVEHLTRRLLFQASVYVHYSLVGGL